MELSLSQWHVKFYFWCLEVWDAFRDRHSYKYRSNLCHYIRTIFVWMPLAIVANVSLWLWAFLVLLYYPLTHFGIAGTGTGYAWLAILVGVVVLLYYLVRWYRRRSQAITIIPPTENEEEDKGPSFFEVIWLYLVSVKQKVCPTIDFRFDNNKEVL